MTTITVSVGVVFALGVAVGMTIGVIGLCVVAVAVSAKKKK